LNDLASQNFAFHFAQESSGLRSTNRSGDVANALTDATHKTPHALTAGRSSLPASASTASAGASSGRASSGSSSVQRCPDIRRGQVLVALAELIHRGGMVDNEARKHRAMNSTRHSQKTRPARGERMQRDKMLRGGTFGGDAVDSV
jgi:hypothetical protein